MTYYGKLLSNDLLIHAKRSAREPWALYPEHRPAQKRKTEEMRTKSTYYKWRRACMFRRDPLCHWCRKPMVLIERTATPQKGVRIPSLPNEATIDHLDPRGSPMRGKAAYGEIRLVLACWQCNKERNDEFQKTTPIQTRWEFDRRRFIDIAKRSGALNEVTP